MATARRPRSRNRLKPPVEPRSGVELDDIFQRLRESGRAFDEESLLKVAEVLEQAAGFDALPAFVAGG